MTTSMTFAIVIFSLVNVLGLVMFAAFALNPNFGLKFSNPAAGVDILAIANRDKDSNRALKFLLGFCSSQILAADAFSLLILWIPFRNHEQWAWLAMLYWPIMFMWHYFHYAKKNPSSYIQIVWFVLSVTSLALTYSESFM